MSLEVGAWGCAPWIIIWPLLVPFAPISRRAKSYVILVSLALYIYSLILAVESANNGGEQALEKSLPLVVSVAVAIIGVVLLLAYFILSYGALNQEIKRRKALHDNLGEAAWRRLYYCTVHDRVINE